VPESSTPGGGRPVFATPRPTDSFLTPAPTRRPDVALPYISTMEFRFYDDVDLLAHDWESGALDAVSGLTPADASAFALAVDGASVERYPGTTLLAVLFDLRPSRKDFADPAVRRALLAAIDRDSLVRGPFGGLAERADSPIPPSSPVFDIGSSTAIPYDVTAARKGLTDAGWKESGGSWIPKGATEPLRVEVLSPEEMANPGAYEAAAAVVADWRALGLAATQTPLSATELVGERLATGQFQVAVLPVAIGLDPDLYPLLAASQTRTGGSNVSGLQDPALDKLLVAARTPLAADERRAAYAELQARLQAQQYLLPLAFRDEFVVVRDRLSGPTPRAVGGSGDRFWDVLTWRLADDR
jgi:peptide/nickel transport system substrate-binding protein